MAWTRPNRAARLRDGAYRWHLWRDLDEPGQVTEIFLLGSWEEHLRQGDRATSARLQIEAKVKAFHRGAEPPIVRHSLHLEPGSNACPI